MRCVSPRPRPRPSLTRPAFPPAGAGNSIFPLLAQNTNPHLSIHAYDYSSHAVKLVQVRPLPLSRSRLVSSRSASHPAPTLAQNNPLYAAPPCGSIHAAVWDLASSPADGDGGDSALPPGLAPASADLLVLVFVLSALHPHDWPRALANIHKVRPRPSPPAPPDPA